jgi:hypothetical protein
VPTTFCRPRSLQMLLPSLAASRFDDDDAMGVSMPMI